MKWGHLWARNSALRAPAAGHRDTADFAQREETPECLRSLWFLITLSLLSSSLHLDALSKVKSLPLKLQLIPVLAVGAQVSRTAKALFCWAFEIFEDRDQVPPGLRLFFKHPHFSSLPPSSFHTLHWCGSQNPRSDLCDLCRVHATLPCPVPVRDPAHRTLQNTLGFWFLYLLFFTQILPHLYLRN